MAAYPSHGKVSAMRDFFIHTYDLLVKGSAAIMGFFHGMTSGNHRSAVLLLCLMAADYLTGLIAAWLNKSRKPKTGKPRSAAAFRGLLRKVLMALVLIVSAVLDWFIGDHNAMFFTAVCWMYIGSEALSLLENLTLCGVPVPAALKRRLALFSRTEESGIQQPAPDLPQTIS